MPLTTSPLRLLEFFVDHFPLGVLHLLDDDLFGRLSGDAPQEVGIHANAQFVADFAFRVDLERLLVGDLLVRVGDLFDHFLELEGFDLSVFLVEGHVQIQLAAVFLLDGRFDRFFQGTDQGLAVDTLFPTHLVDQPLQITDHGFPSPQEPILNGCRIMHPSNQSNAIELFQYRPARFQKVDRHNRQPPAVHRQPAAPP